MTTTAVPVLAVLGATSLRWEGAGLTSAVLGIGLVVVLVVALLESRGDASPSRRVGRTVVRSLALLAIGAALLRPSLASEESAPRRVVVLVDEQSVASTDGRAATEALLARARASAEQERAALIVVPFGETPRRGSAAGAGNDGQAVTPLDSPATRSDRGGASRSRMAPALAGASLAAGSPSAAAAILVTDGRASLDGARDAAAALRGSGVALRWVAIPTPRDAAASPPAASIDALSAPKDTRGPFAVRAAVTTPMATTARLLVDGVEQASKPVAAGGGEVAFDGVTLAPGPHEVVMSVDAGTTSFEPSADVANPPARPPERAVLSRSVVNVLAPPRALVISNAADGGVARRSLSAQGVTVAVVPSAGARSAVASSPADLVVLDADAAAGLDAESLAGLRRRVEGGVGLFVLAGDDVGAWTALGTGPLAASPSGVLPLVPMPPPPAPPPPPKPPPDPEPDPETEPDPEPTPPTPGPGLVAQKRPEEALPVALLLVVDRSGSMALAGKLRMAIAAAEEAAAQLAPTDRVGVVTFADDATVDVPMHAAGSAPTLGLGLGIAADGNTDIFKALQAAAQVMRAERASIRHIVLLTDGQDSKSNVYGSLPLDLAAEKITITTVGIGYSIDEWSLKSLATQGGGRFLPAATARDLPRILTRDTRTVLDERADAVEKARLSDEAKNPPKPPAPKTPPRPRPPRKKPPAPPPPTVEKPDVGPLVRVRRHEALSGIPDADLPTVGAPRPARLADGAALLLSRDDGRPVLAAGRAGLGLVVVLALPTGDAGLRSWNALSRLLTQAARAVAAPLDAHPTASMRVTPSPRGDVLSISIPDGMPVADAAAAASAFRVTVDRAAGPAAATTLGIEDGEARFLLPPSDGAIGVARVALDLGGARGVTWPPLSYAASEPPREPRPDLDAVADALGVAASPASDSGLFHVPAKSVAAPISIVPLVLALALLLLPLDAVLHRRSPRAPRVPNTTASRASLPHAA